ncbi:hypothetical protein C8J57DRAFT_1728636 [Mycena rebaudengoi]|nr:hypothetical protein C8J57DRAFT_1728636 [Mycena rebaudengoi]
MSVASNFGRDTAQRRRDFGKNTGAAPIVHAEDSQPNESIDKRRAVPSLVVPSANQKQRLGNSGWVSRGYDRGRGRGRGRGLAHDSGDRRLAQQINGRSTSFSARDIPKMNGGGSGYASGYPPRNAAAPVVPQPTQHTAGIAHNNRVFSVPSTTSRRDSFAAYAVRPVSRYSALLNSGQPTASSSSSAPPSWFRPPPTSSSQPPRVPVPVYPPIPYSVPEPLSDAFGPSSNIPSSSVPATRSSPPPTKRRRIDTPAIRIVDPPSVLSRPSAPIPHSPPSPIRVDALAVKTEESPSELPPSPPPPAPRSPPPPICVKTEARTPSPPPANPPRRAVTSGSKRCFPVPYDCTRAARNTDFAANRRKWARSECTLLRDLGLHVEKFFFRDDGMVIEWTSSEPVWLDTLRPVRTRVRTPVDIPTDVEIIDIDADPESPPRNPSPLPGPTLPVPSSVPDDTVATDDADDEQIEIEIHELGLQFVQQYILTFDSERPALAQAYTDDAVFSFRDTDLAAPAHFTFQRAARLAQAGKSTMPALPRLHDYRFSAGGAPVDVDYDTVLLEGDEGMLLVTVYGQLVGPVGQQRGVDQSFVLRRPVEGEKGPWPLLAVSHQMVVRDTPWMRGAKDRAIPWMDS